MCNIFCITYHFQQNAEAPSCLNFFLGGWGVLAIRHSCIGVTLIYENGEDWNVQLTLLFFVLFFLSFFLFFSSPMFLVLYNNRKCSHCLGWTYCHHLEGRNDNRWETGFVGNGVHRSNYVDNRTDCFKAREAGSIGTRCKEQGHLMALVRNS